MRYPEARRILQISLCGAASTPSDMTEQPLCLVARTAQYCSVIIVEAPDQERHTRTVEPLLFNAGLRRERRLEARIYGAYNPVYVLPARVPEKCILCTADSSHPSQESKECQRKYLGPRRS